MVYTIALCTGMNKACLLYMCVVVCMGSRFVSYIHVLPCPHNEVYTVWRTPSVMREPSERLLSL
jgi:hypothetical protein